MLFSFPKQKVVLQLSNYFVVVSLCSYVMICVARKVADVCLSCALLVSPFVI